ncbi:four and a half LIM domains protein limpet isoform X3 [Ptiloglossa arizonensis]|uniref:four and a half LIM domains protein limpet isoform X3 n=1 Tax=Ptiloglossa arizonensis TaxID=3350558 RepID=UPI003FA14EFD
MGLMLSVLVGCVGVLELLACLRHVTDGVIITINQPATPCLSYHEQNDNVSTHDSICSYSHSSDANVPRGAKHKLENLHEYSLRIRAQLRSRDKNFDYGNLSECSLPRDYLSGARLTPDSRLSPDFNYLVEASESGDVGLGPEDGRSELEDGRSELENARLGLENARLELENGRLELEDGRSKLEDCRLELEDAKSGLEDARLGLEDTRLELENGGLQLEDDYERRFEALYLETETQRVENSSRDRPLSVTTPEPDKYVRVPTPIPFDPEEDKYSSSGASSDVGTSFDNDSGNEAPTMKTFDQIPVISRYESLSDGESSRDEFEEREKLPRRPFRKSHSRSPDPTRSIAIEENLGEIEMKLEGIRVTVPRKRIGKSTSTIVRKPRLKSKNSTVSKSAENLTAKKSKRHREPERRKSEITAQSFYKDEWTNTSPLGSPTVLSRSGSRKSVSVQVQTSFDETLGSVETPVEYESSAVVGLSESRKDLSSRDRLGRKSSFKNKRFGSSGSRDKVVDDPRDAPMTNATTSVEGLKDTARLLKISSFEEAEVQDYARIRNILNTDSDSRDSYEKRRKGSRSTSSFDEDFWDAEDLIFSGEYTKAMNKDWHSGHFCCWQCDESLTGQRYVLRDEHPYCIKCYESVFANGCEECNKIIGIDSKDLSYKDKHWHEACFLCNRCRVSLVDKQFGSKVDKIYCGNCYDAQFASRCDGCGEIFRAGTKKMEYKTRQWHEKCFCCVVCKNPIGTKSFIPREQEIYCAGCYEDKFATRCVKCNKIINSGGVTYKNEPWHRDCFTCSNCNNSLAGQRFTSRDDKPYCADCFGELFAKRCTACSKPITGIGGTRFISFEDRHWHNDCFICAGCKTSLVGRGFITDNEDIICPECAKMKLM